VATKLKVMGVEVASLGVADPQVPEDEVIQFSDPKRGTYKKLIIRDGRLVGGILLGDISKAAYLMQSFDRNTPLPEERLGLLFDLGDPPKQVTFEEMSANTQICNCNGVSKGALMECVQSGKRNQKAVMDATRAGMGCGSCKAMVTEIVEWACGGKVEEDPWKEVYSTAVAKEYAPLLPVLS
jgi:nitrite reductase (NADH) large subunit